MIRLLFLGLLVLAQNSFAKQHTRLVKKNLKCARYLIDKSIDGLKSVDYAYQILKQTYENASNKNELRDILKQCREYKKLPSREKEVFNEDLSEYFYDNYKVREGDDKIEYASLLVDFINPKLVCRGLSAQAGISSVLGFKTGPASMICEGSNGRVYKAFAIDIEVGLGVHASATLSYIRDFDIVRNGKNEHLDATSADIGAGPLIVMDTDRSLYGAKFGFGVGYGLFVTAIRHMYLRFIGIGNQMKKIAKEFHD